MFIKAIRVGRFRHLADIELTVAGQREASSAVVLAGRNGGGKSSLLEIISYAVASSDAYGWGSARTFGEHAFEVDIGLTPDEAALIDTWLTQSGQRPGYPVEEIQQFSRERWYTRYFGMAPNGSAEQQRHDRAHNLVLVALRQHYGRPIGFSIAGGPQLSPHRLRAAETVAATGQPPTSGQYGVFDSGVSVPRHARFPYRAAVSLSPPKGSVSSSLGGRDEYGQAAESHLAIQRAAATSASRLRACLTPERSPKQLVGSDSRWRTSSVQRPLVGREGSVLRLGELHSPRRCARDCGRGRTRTAPASGTCPPTGAHDA